MLFQTIIHKPSSVAFDSLSFFVGISLGEDLTIVMIDSELFMLHKSVAPVFAHFQAVVL